MTDDELAGGDVAPESPDVVDVRRLLAEARHTEPMPADVATRMSDVLRGLGEEKPPALAHEAVVVPITAQRRRRTAGLLLAAAVVVGAVVVAPRVIGGPGSHGAAGTAQDSSGGEVLGNTGNASGSSSAGTGSTPATSPSPPHSRLAPLRHGRLVVRPRQFSADALQGRALLRRTTLRAQADRTAVQSCAGLPRAAKVLPAEYLRAPAALVYRAAEGGSQVVDLFVCGNRRPVRSATLPAP